MGLRQSVLRSLLRVFRAVPLPPALTLPLPLSPTPPPACIHGDRARGFPEHLRRGFDVRRTMATSGRMTYAGHHGNCLHEAAAVSEFSIVSADSSVWVTLILYFRTSSSASPTTPPTRLLHTPKHTAHQTTPPRCPHTAANSRFLCRFNS